MKTIKYLPLPPLPKDLIIGLKVFKEYFKERCGEDVYEAYFGKLKND